MNIKTKLFNPFLCASALIAGATATAQAQNQQGYILNDVIGKVCWVEAYTNSAATWTMTIKDGGKTVLVYQGKGVNFAPMKVIKGSARFTVRHGAIATFKSATGKAAIKVRNSVILDSTGDPAVFGSLFGGEDGGDDDWQDILANVTCLHHAG